MPSVRPRINTVLEPPLYDAVKRLAKRDSVSLRKRCANSSARLCRCRKTRRWRLS